VIEGIDGSGKSWLVEQLAAWADANEIKHVVTDEPYDDTVTDVTGLQQVTAFAHDRKQHLDNVIRPALSDGKLVICDRYVESSHAYQAPAVAQHRVGPDSISETEQWIANVNDFADEPDLTLLLDLPPSDALERASDASSEPSLDALAKARKRYQERLERCDHGVRIIDASRSKAYVSYQAENALIALGVHEANAPDSLDDSRSAAGGGGALETYANALRDKDD
jgi:dTMP kinase